MYVHVQYMQGFFQVFQKDYLNIYWEGGGKTLGVHLHLDFMEGDKIFQVGRGGGQMPLPATS